MTDSFDDEAALQKLAEAAADLLAANEARQVALEAAKKAALAAYVAGMSEAELASLFNVDRARTIRRWLGKMN